jgi:hypothetical protein
VIHDQILPLNGAGVGATVTPMINPGASTADELLPCLLAARVAGACIAIVPAALGEATAVDGLIVLGTDRLNEALNLLKHRPCPSH